MSYTSELKDSILELTFSPAGRNALIIGILAVNGKVTEDGVTVCISGKNPANAVEQWFHDRFGHVPKTGKYRYGKEIYTISVLSHSAEKLLSELSEKPISELLSKPLEECRKAALCGMILAGGRVTNPEKSYHFEICCKNNREAVVEFLSEFGYVPGVTDRKGEALVYFKDNAIIGEILMQAGLSNQGFSFINQTIVHQYRAEASRTANCVARNIAVSVDATQRQITLIKKLKKAGKMSVLPPELRETAEFRLKNEDLTLSQMASAMVPPLTKSGLNHRLRKIIAIAQKELSD